MNVTAPLLIALVFLLTAIGVALVFIRNDWLIELRYRVTGWKWTELSERALLDPDGLTPAEKAALPKLLDAIQRYKHYKGRNTHEELWQRLTALRVLAHGPNPESRYDALREVAGIAALLSQDLTAEDDEAGVRYRDLSGFIFTYLYPGAPEPAEPRHGWEFKRLQANPPSQKQIFELLATVVFCLTARLAAQANGHPTIAGRQPAG